MKRQKRFKKIQIPFFIEGLKGFVAKQIPVIAVIAIFIMLSWALAKAFLEKSDYFRLKSIEAKGAAEVSLVSIRSELLRTYRERNVFKINIKTIAKNLEARYPDAKEVIVKRVLPDKLLVELNFRKPVAFLGNGRYYPIDREGFVLLNIDTRNLKDFPIIQGLDVRYDGRTPKRCDSKNLQIALQLLDEIKRARFLSKYRANNINAGDIRNLSFYLMNGVEVRIGYENFKERLALLEKTLKDPRILLDKIKYIDLRFKDVVIGPK